MLKVICGILCFLLIAPNLVVSAEESSRSSRRNKVEKSSPKNFFLRLFIPSDKKSKKEKVNIAEKEEKKTTVVKEAKPKETVNVVPRMNYNYRLAQNAEKQVIVEEKPIPSPEVKKVLKNGDEKIKIYDSSLPAFDEKDLQAFRQQKKSSSYTAKQSNNAND